MNKKLRATRALLLCVVLLLSGCSKEAKKTDLTLTLSVGGSSTVSGGSLRPISVGTGIKAEPIDRFPAGFKSKYPLTQGSWYSDRPLIDPLGSEDSYSSISQYYDYGEMVYVNQNYRMTKQMLAGDSWTLEFSDESPDAILHLEKYILDLGGTILTPASEEIVFMLDDVEGFNWWGKISTGNIISIEVFRERSLKVGSTLKADPSHLSQQPNFFFTTRHDGTRMQSLTIKLNDAYEGDEIIITAEGGYNSGLYAREVRYYALLTAGSNKTNVFTLDDIPQEPGYTTWTLQSNNTDMTVEFSLSETTDLTPIVYGESLGALLVKGVPYGSVSIPVTEVSNHTDYSISHPDLGEDLDIIQGDQTPSGDTMFWLPSGFWNLDVYSDVLSTTSHARLIPVSEGQLTVVDMASNIGSIFTKTAGSVEGTVEHGMTFLDEPKEQGDNVTLQFLLFDSQNEDALPTKETTIIHENGAPVEVLKVDKLDTPPSVVLLLDSSGSMADQMKPAIESAKAFVQGLPDNATVQVVDFDNTARLLPGKTKSEVLKGLDSATTGGSTALYDAAVMGLNILKDMRAQHLSCLQTVRMSPPLVGSPTRAQS